MSQTKTFQNVFQALCDRTGKHVGVAYEGLPVDWKYLLDRNLKKALEAWTWPDRVLLEKIAIATDENGAAYIDYPDGEILAIYDCDPLTETTTGSGLEFRIFNSRVYVPTTELYVWLERVPTADSYIGTEADVVPGYVIDGAVEHTLADLLEIDGAHEKAAYQHNVADKILRENYARLAPLRLNKIHVKTS